MFCCLPLNRLLLLLQLPLKGKKEQLQKKYATSHCVYNWGHVRQEYFGIQKWACSHCVLPHRCPLALFTKRLSLDRLA